MVSLVAVAWFILAVSVNIPFADDMAILVDATLDWNYDSTHP